MDTDCLVLSFSESKVIDKHMDVVNLDTQDNTNEKVLGKFKNMIFLSELIEEFVILSLNANIYMYCGKRKSKEKGMKKCNNAKHED